MIDREKVAAAVLGELEDDLDGPEEYRLGVARAVADVAIAAVLEQLPKQGITITDAPA